MHSVLAPGQGSQTPGFLQPWLEVDGALETLKHWSQLCDLDLVHLGTVADKDEITDTSRTQPLLVAAGILAAQQLPDNFAGVVAGHSVGELTAAYLAEVVTADDAIKLAAVRGRAMAEACALVPTGMSAVLGGDSDEVLAAIESAGAYPANQNGGGQVVAAGTLESLEKLAAAPPEKARVRPLQVAGAFHTPYMHSAHQKLTAAAADIDFADPTIVWLSNYDGTPVSSGEDARTRLVEQVTAPVRWDACTESLRNREITGMVELPPAGTLAGMAKRQLKGVPVVKFNTPDDLKAVTELVDQAEGA